MKFKLINLSVLLLGIITNQIAKAQVDPECKKYIQDYTQKIANLDSLVGGQVCYMKINMTVKEKGKSEETKTSVELIYDKDFQWVKNNQMTIIQDKKDLYMVYPEKKMVYKSSSLTEENKKKRTTDFIAGFNLNLEQLNSLTCEESNDKKAIHLVYKENHSSGIQNIVYHYDPKINMMNHVAITYNEAHPIQTQSMTYEVFDKNYKKLKNKSAASYIYDKKGQLKEAYAGYKVIDSQ